MEMSDIDEIFNQINPQQHHPIPTVQDINQIIPDNPANNMVSYSDMLLKIVVYLCDIIGKCHDHNCELKTQKCIQHSTFTELYIILIKFY